MFVVLDEVAAEFGAGAVESAEHATKPAEAHKIAILRSLRGELNISLSFCLYPMDNAILRKAG